MKSDIARLEPIIHIIHTMLDVLEGLKKDFLRCKV